MNFSILDFYSSCWPQHLWPPPLPPQKKHLMLVLNRPSGSLLRLFLPCWGTHRLMSAGCISQSPGLMLFHWSFVLRMFCQLLKDRWKGDVSAFSLWFSLRQCRGRGQVSYLTPVLLIQILLIFLGPWFSAIPPDLSHFTVGASRTYCC